MDEFKANFSGTAGELVDQNLCFRMGQKRSLVRGRAGGAEQPWHGTV